MSSLSEYIEKPAPKLPGSPLIHLVWLLLIVFLSGCSPLVTQSQSLITSYTELVPGTAIGQTFVSPHDGLAGIELNLSPGIPGSGEIVLRLKTDPTASEVVATARLPVEEVNATGEYCFTFEPIKDSRRQYYYATFDLYGEGSIQLGITWGYAYLDGALYSNHQPQDAQLTFALVFDRLQVIVGILRQVMTWAAILLASVFLYILPGWAVMKAAWPQWDKVEWVEKWALSTGVGLAMIPLFFLWTDVIGLHLGTWYAWILGFGALFALLWMNLKRGKPIKLAFRLNVERSAIFPKYIPDAVLVVVMLIVFAVRFWSISNLDLPMWGDSYQHTVLTQLLLDNGGMFDSWEPYAPLESLTYHFGFHADTAVFGWLSGLSASRAIIWVGQVFNGMAALAVYPLARRLGQNRWAGIVAVLLSGLVFSIPMSYVNWGRYTQLAGQIILPVIAFLVWQGLQEQKVKLSQIGLMAVAMGGLALTHYRIMILAVLIYPAWFILYARRKNIKRSVIRIFLMGLGTGVLTLPWFGRVFGARLFTILQTQLTTLPSANPAGLDQYNSIGNILAYLPAWAWLFFILLIGIGLWYRKEGTGYVALWWLLILLAANPAWFNLPGTGTLSNFAVFIAAYIPVSITLGAGVGWILEKQLAWQPRFAWLGVVVLTVMVLGVAGIGSRQRLDDVRINEFSLATRPDLNAASWIRDNIPPDAKFVVNYFFAYLDTLIVGSDGGWWLPLLTQRESILPPLTYGVEDSSGDEYLSDTNELARDIQDRGITDPGIIERLVDDGYDYLYIGQRQGKVNNPGPAILEPDMIFADPYFDLLYQRDRVLIFRIIP